MSIEDIFPSTELSITEQNILAETFSTPVVKKYLKEMALNDTKELLSLGATDFQDSVLIKAHATVQGRLQVIGTLLSIEAVVQPTNPPEEQ